MRELYNDTILRLISGVDILFKRIVIFFRSLMDFVLVFQEECYLTHNAKYRLFCSPRF